MRKTLLAAVVLAALTLALAGGAPAQMGMVVPPKADGAELWKFITKTMPYGKWGQWQDHKGMLPSVAPHGKFTTVYVSDPALASAKPPVADNGIVVKENFDGDRKLVAVTVMYKVRGYNPQAGDWFWAKYAPDGTVQAEGKVGACIDCHAGRAASDYLMVHDFK